MFLGSCASRGNLAPESSSSSDSFFNKELAGDELSEEAKAVLVEDIIDAYQKIDESEPNAPEEKDPEAEVAATSVSPRPGPEPSARPTELRQLIQQSAEHKRRASKLRKLDVPVEINKDVLQWVKFFAVKDRDRFQRFLDRGEAYRDVVESTLQAHDVPPELYYLGMIESGYSNHAVSHASAVGPWQFIRGTARRYGLEVGYYNDERRDPIRSSEAAAKYLRDLYQEFGSWYLAMAAYNSGENRVRRAIRRAGSRDYWELTRRRYLPRETRNYVPKFLAALVIGRHPEWFGFDPSKTQKYPSVQAVEVPRAVHFSSIAKVSEVSAEELAQVNPHLRKEVTPPGSGNYEIWVPSDKSQHLSSKTEELLAYVDASVKPQRFLAYEAGSYHRVRHGQTLGAIARRYRVTVSYLKRVNGLRTSRIYVGQRLRVRSSGYARARVNPVVHRGDVAFHTVRRGQNLGMIARRYGVTVSQLKRFNGLDNSTIVAGQKLRVRPHMMVSLRQRELASRGVRIKKGQRIYRVRRGDNLTTIARKFGISVYQLKELNNLDRNTIYTGQSLRVAAR